MNAVAVRDFDVPYSARFVLGPYWRSATENERTEFTKAYEAYVVHVYAGKFRIYHDVEVAVIGERQESQTHMLVRTKIIRSDGRPPLDVDWHLATTSQPYKIIDVNIGGISQVVTFREQFAVLMERNPGGVAMLTERLREKTRE